MASGRPRGRGSVAGPVPGSIARSIVLASRSPQRREILSRLGIEFTAVSPDVEELREGEPASVVRENALRKARAGLVATGATALVIGCDTEVVLDGRVLGKPAGAEQALAGLRSLSGRRHEVLSGLAIVGPAVAEGETPERSGVSRSLVDFKRLDEATLERYVASGEWRERAGGYAIQGLGAALVERVEGDVANVIGLPVGLLWELAPELL
ncbi:MAG: nucleoside triphosphate pyrophosphatase [Solirubrobacterales bacterium]|jgi:septum formation protein|nr:nucleoside triphosphate pyrophosphatase [Solirubrobacterales bacterium]